MHYQYTVEIWRDLWTTWSVISVVTRVKWCQRLDNLTQAGPRYYSRISQVQTYGVDS